MTTWLLQNTGWTSSIGWGTWVVVAVCILALWGLVAAIVVALTPTGTGAAHAPSTAMQILDERFARGEIDEAEYQQRTQLLEPHHR